MAFVKISGFKGKIYVPDVTPGVTKKHGCKDCFSCQKCGDSRCRVCLNQTHRNGKKPAEKP